MTLGLGELKIDIIGVKCVENFQILLEAFADVGLDDGRVQDVLPDLATCVYIAIKAIGGDEAMLIGHSNSSR